MSCYINYLATFKRKLQHVGHKWVICGSHPDSSVGQWVKWVNRCDPLSTLVIIYVYSYVAVLISYTFCKIIECLSNINHVNFYSYVASQLVNIILFDDLL